MTNQRRDRLQVTTTEPMRIALTVLAERSGLPLATQATMLLRQALHQTINSAEVQRRVAAHKAYRTQAQWQAETTTEHAVETTYADLEKRHADETTQRPQEGLQAAHGAETV